MINNNNADVHQVQQLPVTPTEKGRSEEIPSPEVLVFLDYGNGEGNLHTVEELIEIGFIKRGVHDSDGQLHDS